MISNPPYFFMKNLISKVHIVRCYINNICLSISMHVSFLQPTLLTQYLLPGERKHIWRVMVVIRIDIVLRAILSSKVVCFVTVHNSTQSISTRNISNCRVHLKVYVERLACIVVEKYFDKCSSREIYLKKRKFVYSCFIP